jgi:hypothetical protein
MRDLFARQLNPIRHASRNQSLLTNLAQLKIAIWDRFLESC